MKIEEKRKVIEVLLSASGSPVVSTCTVAEDAGVDIEHVRDVLTPTYRDVCRYDFRYVDRQVEAAYRLIESSSTLRREWFGR